MIENNRTQAVIDKYEIIEVSTISRWCRDSGDWAGLVECFHSDAQVQSSWFTGSPSEFGQRSKEMMAGHHPKDVQRHVVGNPRVALKGQRAVCEYGVILYQYRVIDGYEFDLTTWSVCLDLFEKRDGRWRISKRITIYEKDRMDPHNPVEVPESYFARMDLSRYPAAIRYHCYRNERSGYPPSANLVLKGTPQEETVREEAVEWLAGR